MEVMLEPLEAELGWSEFKSAHTGSRLPKANTANYEVLGCTLVGAGRVFSVGCVVEPYMLGF